MRRFQTMKSKLHFKELMTCTLLMVLFNSIMSLEAQDYLISFAGSGATTTVGTVKVENLTQGTNQTMSGSNVLHLMNVISGIEHYTNDSKRGISFSPNPMTDHTLIKFDLPENGQTTISLFDITGRNILQIRDDLLRGQHTCRIKGIDNGLYIVQIISNNYSLSGRLLCSGNSKDDPAIVYENTAPTENKESGSKGIDAETVMLYNAGDRLKLTGISDKYSTVMVDVPTESKTITFNFIDCTDGDNNNYPIVKIGDQVWMAENLKTTKYSNSTSIPFVNTTSGWDILTETDEAFCYLNDNIINANIYGALYTWGAAMKRAVSSNSNPSGVQGVCPTNWHLPSDIEWTILISHLGGASVAGGKLKETGTSHWNSISPEATNESGFTALPGGFRDDWAFMGNGVLGHWWSSSEENTSNALYKRVDSEFSIVYSMNSIKKWGHSVRCIKDN